MIKKFVVGVFLVCALCGTSTADEAKTVSADKISVSTVSADVKTNVENDAVLTALLAEARESNPQIGAARERINEARYGVKGAKAKMSPHLNASASFLWQKDGMALLLKVMDRQTYYAAVTLSQIIYSGGTLQAQRDAALLTERAERENIVRTEQTVDHLVSRAYYAMRSAQAKYLVTQESLSMARAHADRARKFFKAGVVPKNDVLRGDVAVAEAEYNAIRANNGVNVAREALICALGRETSVDLKEKRSLQEIVFDKYLPTQTGTDKLLAEAFENRSELKVFSIMSKKAQKLADAARGQTLPQILANVGYIRTSHLMKDLDEPYASIGLAWNMYDSGETRAKTEEAKSKARELLLLLEDKKNQIRMEVRQAQMSLEAAQARLEVARRQFEKSSEDYMIAFRRYEEHVGTNIDTIDARVAVTKSASDLVNAIYDIMLAESDLIFAVGE